MPIEIVIDTMITEAIIAENYDRAIALALSELVKELRYIRGELEALNEKKEGDV